MTTVHLEPHLQDITIPANLRINDQVNMFRKQCLEGGCDAPYHHFAFGQSPFPPPPSVMEALARNVKQHAYLPTAGLPELRESVARYYARVFGIECSAQQVVVSPGSKEVIANIMAAVSGPVIVPTPSWVSYLPQAKILRKQVVCLSTRTADGFKLTPDLLLDGVGHLAAPQKLLILNHPNNPTGAVYTDGELRDLAAVCRQENVIVISDEIYALTTFDIDSFTSLAAHYPEGTIITGGLSKDRSCGGYRVGVAVFPKDSPDLVENVLKIAGSTYSCVAAPIQHAAVEAYSGDHTVEGFIRDCRAVNALAGRTISTLLGEIDGVKTTTPAGAFYLLVDFNEQKRELQRLGHESCMTFCEDMLHIEHVALLPGEALLLPGDDFSVRCSYVDYDGDKALAEWRRRRPETEAERKDFAARHFGLMLKGVENIAHYVREVRHGRQPIHS